MSEDTATVEQTEDEWRESRFTEEQICADKHVTSALRGQQPTFTQLKEACEQYGPEGILESALHLPRDQFEKLEKLCAKNQPKRIPKARVRRTRR